MSETPVIVAPDGRPARASISTDCPDCRAPKARRVNAAGFGDPVIVCGQCGRPFPGETKC